MTREAIAQGFNHFKVRSLPLIPSLVTSLASLPDPHALARLQMKVGGGVENDKRRLALIRSIIDDPKECAGRPEPSKASLEGKQAGPTGSCLMIDSNQVWDVQEAVDYVKQLADARPWFIEEVRPSLHQP